MTEEQPEAVSPSGELLEHARLVVRSVVYGDWTKLTALPATPKAQNAAYAWVLRFISVRVTALTPPTELLPMAEASFKEWLEQPTP